MWVPQNGLQEPDRGDPVGHGVVDADGDRFAAVGKWADQVESPQWPLAVEVLGHQRAHGPPEVIPRGAFGLRLPPDVFADVEIGCVDPSRFISGYVDALRRARLGGQSLRHFSLKGVEVERTGPRLEHDELQGMSGDRRGLEPQDARIVNGEPVAILTGHVTSVWAAIR